MNWAKMRFTMPATNPLIRAIWTRSWHLTSAMYLTGRDTFVHVVGLSTCSGNLQLPRENVIKGLLDRSFVTRLDRCVYERRSASFSDRTFHAPKPDARQSRSAPRPAKSNWSEPLSERAREFFACSHIQLT